MPHRATQHSRSRGQPARQSYQIRMVRAIVAEIAWLDWPVHWRGGRVVWQHPERGAFAPTPADLSLVQRRLQQLRQYQAAARQVLGNVQVWIERRTAQLEQAVLLQAVAAPDLLELVAGVPTSDLALIQRLSSLLLAEAVCVNALAASPAAALVTCGNAASGALRQLLGNATTPPSAQALAALTLGALHNAVTLSFSPSAALTTLPTAWLRRAFAWGRQHGLPPDLWLAVYLLSDPDGDLLLQRYMQSRKASRHFRMSPEVIHTFVVSQMSPGRVVLLVEALVAAEPLARRILTAGIHSMRRRPQRRHRVDQIFPVAARRRVVTELAALFHTFAQATAEPEVIYLAVNLCRAMFNLSPMIPDLVDATLLVLRKGQDLPVRLLHPYLELLVEQHDAIWKKADIPLGEDVEEMAGWLGNHWDNAIAPLYQLLCITGDKAVVWKAWLLDVHYPLAHVQFPDPGLYGWMIRLLETCAPDDREWIFKLLYFALSHSSPRDAKTIRGVLQAYIAAVRLAPQPMRLNLSQLVLNDIDSKGRNPVDTLSRLTPYISRLARHARFTVFYWAPLLAEMPGLDQSRPDDGLEWLERVLTCLRELEDGQILRRVGHNTLRLGIQLGVALSEGDPEHFETILRSAMHHVFAQWWPHLERGVMALRSFPTICLPLRHLFPQQPQRCADLLVRLGLAMRLGREALDPLYDLEADPAVFLAHYAFPDDWNLFVEEAPTMLLLAGTYLYAQHLRGASMALPAGVRRALEQPQRLTQEMYHLEQLVASKPERTDLATRLVNLRTRLADKSQLRQSAYQEAHERLMQITAEAQLAAVEQQVLACFRERLVELAGSSVPENVPLDDDLLNAILLSVDIQQNRRLLLRLLRAHFAGDTDWRERHPVNAAFLETLDAREVKRAIWLSNFPRIYRCVGVTGGRVHLHLERDPIRILQMGNYFDTCLSFGGYNAFSTVANACELNKRVIYACDESGRVVGRKLIGINEAGELVGFRTYSALSDERSNDQLRTIVWHYVHTFARQCRLRLAEEGSIPLLFAEDWYDDGIVPWREDIPAQASVPASDH